MALTAKPQLISDISQILSFSQHFFRFCHSETFNNAIGGYAFLPGEHPQKMIFAEPGKTT